MNTTKLTTKQQSKQWHVRRWNADPLAHLPAAKQPNAAKTRLRTRLSLPFRY